MDPGEAILERELPARVVVIGDLNAQAVVLVRLLRGLRLITKDGRWSGGRTVIVQMGDVPNRGPGARAAMELLLALTPLAREAGGDILWLLGNHEVLSVLRHEAYVTPEEYMEFATQEEIERFVYARNRYQLELLGLPRLRGTIPPMGGRLRAWEEENAPGREAYRAEMGPTGRLGTAIRRLPVALTMGSLLFVHGGLSPRWAAHGIQGLEAETRRSWAKAPEFYEDVEPQSILRDPLGPLWHRVYALASAPSVRSDLHEVLAATGTRQMVIGHTRTDAVMPGEAGRVLVRHGGRLVMSDVGLGDPGESGAVLVIEKGRFEQWTPGGSKSQVVRVKAR
ncbi:MAG: metallophosphoesterase [Deltaproteobacteria bacterium]|nr:metallophosphoesterase [Deltaproteobacteria bacterium]